MQKLLKSFKSELFPRLIPMGTALGIPFVFKRSAGLFAIVPLIKKSGSSGNNIIIGSPVGEVVFDLLKSKLASFSLFSYENPFNNSPGTSEFAKFPPKIVIERGLTKVEYESLRNSLHDQIDTLIESIEDELIFDQKYKEYKRAFYELMEEGMGVFYESRCREFEPRNNEKLDDEYFSSLDD